LGLSYRLSKKAIKSALKDTIEVELKGIKGEFKNNGGSTLRDAVDGMIATTIANQVDIRNIKHDQNYLLDSAKDHSDLLNQINISLKENEARVKHILHSSATFETDSEGNYIWVSRHWSNISGLTLPEALGKGWIDYIHPDDRLSVVDQWYRTVSTHADFGPVMLRYVNPVTHKTVPVILQASPIFDPESDLVGYVGSVDVLDSEYNEPKL
jgi:PAS domain S-box-containing protein